MHCIMGCKCNVLCCILHILVNIFVYSVYEICMIILGFTFYKNKQVFFLYIYRSHFHCFQQIKYDYKIIIIVMILLSLLIKILILF